MPESDIIQRITAEAKVSKEELDRLVSEKEQEFSGLVSRQGALLLVAKDLGLDLIQNMSKDLKVKNITVGMNKVNFFGKIVHISDVKEFQTKDGNAGKVLNIILGDETGTIRLSLWNEKTEVADQLKAGDVLEVINGFVKEDYKGNPEVRLSKYGNLRIAEDVSIEVKQEDRQSSNYKPATLDKVAVGDAVSVKAHLVQLYERKMLHFVCPECKKKVAGEQCETHGEIKPELFLVMSGVVDDGSSTINVSFFNNDVEFLVGKNAEEIQKKVMYEGEKSIFASLDVLGNFLNIRGLVKENPVSGSKELASRSVKAVDPISEIGESLKQFPELKTELQVN